jgi:hypothetical protein
MNKIHLAEPQVGRRYETAEHGEYAGAGIKHTPIPSKKNRMKTTVTTKDVKPGDSIRIPGKRKYRTVKVVGEPLSAARGDRITAKFEGYYLITYDDCGSIAFPPDFVFEIGK